MHLNIEDQTLNARVLPAVIMLHGGCFFSTCTIILSTAWCQLVRDRGIPMLNHVVSLQVDPITKEVALLLVQVSWA